MKMSVYRFKYLGRSEYAKFYASDIYERLGDEIRKMNADALIPIPIHPSRQRERGYNQAQELSLELSRLLGIPTYSDIVKRVKKTIPQKELNPIERQNNLKKAFNISSDVVKLNKTILIDDIYTTGSTIDAVAAVLKGHGVKEVFFITLCIGEGI
jgi:ComF family protein